MKIINSPKCLEYKESGYPESPERVSRCYDFLQDKFDIIEPETCSDEDILRVHTGGLLHRVESGDYFDADTPNLPDIYEYARLSAGAALSAVKTAMKGEPAFSLMRPPGHHAGRGFLGGFCYFNNIAIAIRYVQEKLDVKKILILDIDCHHGNGTQDIFLGDESVLYISLHQSPLYPGTGLKSEKNCLNFPIPAGTNGQQYLETFYSALEVVDSLSPDLIAVSAGFDAYKDDPITGLSLDKQTYYDIAQKIYSLGLPVFSVLEGGYSEDMPFCVYEYLSGFKN